MRLFSGIAAAFKPVFPRTVKRHWYCGAWHLHRGKEGRIVFNPFRTGFCGDDTSELIDGLIPAIRVGDRIGLYKQVGQKYRETSFYDGAPWDDGYMVDLRYVRSVRAAMVDKSTETARAKEQASMSREDR